MLTRYYTACHQVSHTHVTQGLTASAAPQPCELAIGQESTLKSCCCELVFCVTHVTSYLGIVQGDQHSAPTYSARVSYHGSEQYWQ